MWPAPLIALPKTAAVMEQAECTPAITALTANVVQEVGSAHAAATTFLAYLQHAVVS